jgi:hypothetical protein
MFPSFEVFNTVMNQTTENYECLVIDKKSQSNRLEDQVFWYKADANVNYKLCSPELWHIQETHDEKEALGLSQPVDDEEDYNPMIVKKKNAPVIRVKKAQY